MLRHGRGGVTDFGMVGPSFAPQTERVAGNQLPGWTGTTGLTPAQPGPGPHAGGQVGRYDGASGTDPSRPEMSPEPVVFVAGAENDDWGNHPSFWRGGIQGFNDQLQVRDRHAYYDRGSQTTGITRSVPGNPPNNHEGGPARPDLRLVNVSVNPQIGSDHTGFQDDLSRPFTWLGQQDGTTSPVYGGVPGLYVPYGTRGGVPYPIRAPVAEGEPGDGPAMVFSGPPHGLHSETLPSGKQVIERYASTPQMRPVRLDRPDNARAAGQSYSQTLPMQGQAGAREQERARPGRGGFGLHLDVGGRGWAGA